jgi:predicted nuclease of predicted toxin-antitoxin system
MTLELHWFMRLVTEPSCSGGMTTIWVDAHLSPAIATWITANFDVTAVALRDLSLRDAEDSEIFEAAKAQGAILMTKDRDFVDLVDRLGPPPKVIWLTCGNTSNARLKKILTATLLTALKLLMGGEPLVEISGE